MINNSSKEDFSSKKMYKFRVIKSCFNGNVYKSYCWQGIKFEVFLLEISAKIIGNIFADVSTKNRQNGEAEKHFLKWNIDSKLTKCAVKKTTHAFLASTISKNIVA